MEKTLRKTNDFHWDAIWQKCASFMGIVVLIAIAMWMALSQFNEVRTQKQLAADKVAFEGQTGIRVVRIVLTGGGGIIDLQYQVVDPDKALIVHDSERPPMMLDQKSNLIFANPFHEHAARELHTAVTYHELIMNGGGLLQHGSKITLSIGEWKLENLVVE